MARSAWSCWGRTWCCRRSLVRDRRLDYVALGHIHKPQDLNPGAQPPVIYPGSIERVDFGEAADDRFFVIAHVGRGNTRVEWKKLTQARRFIERRTTLKPALAAAEASAENVTEALEVRAAISAGAGGRDPQAHGRLPAGIRCPDR